MDSGIEYLLCLHGSILDQNDGYWVKIKAWEITPGEQIPHGIRYSLTLHDPSGDRLLGFDNAHPVADPSKGKYVPDRKLIEWDHEHRLGKEHIYPYEFETAEKLLSDFWTEVDGALTALRGKR